MIDFGQKVYAYFGTPIFDEILGFASTREFDDNFAQMCIECNLDDVVSLKVKGEVRKLNKRPRLVCMVSAIQNSAWRTALTNALIEEQLHPEIPTAVALDLITPSETRARYEVFKRHAPLSSNDIQGWEWSNNIRTHYIPFYRWCYVLKLTDSSLKVYEEKRKHFYLLLALYVVTAHRVIAVEDGELYTTPTGQVSSGKLTTLSDSSCIRSWLSFKAAIFNGYELKFAQSCGDDNLDSNPDLRHWYRDYGFVITDQLTQTDTFSFCSTTFTSTCSYIENIEKFFVSCCYKFGKDKEHDARLAAFDIFEHHPERGKYASLLELLTPSVVSG